MNLAKLLFELLHNTAGLEWIAYLLHVLQRSRSIGLLVQVAQKGRAVIPSAVHGWGCTSDLLERKAIVDGTCVLDVDE